MNLDRIMQREILEGLKNSYPNDLEVTEIPHFDENDFQPNLFYLMEHGLIESEKKTEDLRLKTKRINSARITANGLDFLEDDGGIRAILKTITVKFDAENIRSLIEDKIIKSNFSKSEQKSLLEKLKGYSGEALKAITLKLMEIGLENQQIIKDLFS
jgi:hypothetical protein